MHTSWLFGGYRAQYSEAAKSPAARAHSWRTELLASISSEWHEGWKQSHWLMCIWRKRPSSHLQMPWEASFTCSMKERAVTKGEFDWTGNEVGKRITPPHPPKNIGQQLLQRTGLYRVEFHFKVLIYLSWAWHQLKFRTKLGHKLNCKTSRNHRTQSQKTLIHLRLS